MNRNVKKVRQPGDYGGGKAFKVKRKVQRQKGAQCMSKQRRTCMVGERSPQTRPGRNPSHAERQSRALGSDMEDNG